MSGAAPSKKASRLRQKLSKMKSKKAGTARRVVEPAHEAPKAAADARAAEPEPVMDDGITVGVIAQGRSAAITEAQLLEHEQSKRELAKAREAAAMPKAPAPEPEEPKRGLYRPRMVAAPKAEVTNLAGVAAPAAKARGVWAQAARGPSAEAAPAALALGEGRPSVPTSSTLCSGEELDAFALRDAVDAILRDLREDRDTQQRAKDVVALRPAAGPEARVLAATVALSDSPHWESHQSARVGPFLVALLTEGAFSAATLRAELPAVYEAVQDACMDAPRAWDVAADALRPLVEAGTVRVAAGCVEADAMPSRLRDKLGVSDADAGDKAKAATKPEAAAAPSPASAGPAAAAAAAPAGPGPASLAAKPAPSVVRPGSYVPLHLRSGTSAKPGSSTKPGASNAEIALRQAQLEEKERAAKAAAKPAAAPQGLAASNAAAEAALAKSGKKKKKKKAKKADA